MQFTLHHRGNLKANGKAKGEHPRRQHLHEQLKGLWNQPPLNSHRYLFETEDDDEVLIVRPMGDFEFVPVVSSRLSMVAALRNHPAPPRTARKHRYPGRRRGQPADYVARCPESAEPSERVADGRGARGGRVALLLPSPRRYPHTTGPNAKTDRRLDRNAGQPEVALPTHARTRPTVGNFSDLGLVRPPRAPLAVATNLHRARGGAVFLREAARG